MSLCELSLASCPAPFISSPERVTTSYQRQLYHHLLCPFLSTAYFHISLKFVSRFQVLFKNTIFFFFFFPSSVRDPRLLILSICPRAGLLEEMFSVGGGRGYKCALNNHFTSTYCAYFYFGCFILLAVSRHIVDNIHGEHACANLC